MNIKRNLIEIDAIPSYYLILTNEIIFIKEVIE